MEDRYFDWLIAKIDHRRRALDYIEALHYLYERDFESLLSHDDNRASDGLYLRYEFNGKESNDQRCSCLEMLVALAVRCEKDIMGDPRESDKSWKWFWIMFENLGFGRMSDGRFDEAEADRILERFLGRKYRKDGKGGLFPLKYPDEDQRKVEIWYQMCAYLNENYSLT